VVNGLGERIAIVTGAVPGVDASELTGPFDHVMTNPPYMPPGRGRSAGDPSRTAAKVESVDLATWICFGLARLRHRGVLTLVQRADRLDDIVAALSGHAGDVAILPLWPDATGAKPARRVLVRARKGVRSPLRLLPGLVLHETGGGYSQAAERILRDGNSIEWT
jgi:tRNA1(Val) A37 N6-methylase TrmN6